MFGIIVRLFLLIAVLLGYNHINELLDLHSVAIFVSAEDVFESAVNELHINIDSFKIFHVLFIKKFLHFCLHQNSIAILIKLSEGLIS